MVVMVGEISWRSYASEAHMDKFIMIPECFGNLLVVLCLYALLNVMSIVVVYLKGQNHWSFPKEDNESS